MTPISGVFTDTCPFSTVIFLQEYPISPAEASQKIPPTAGDKSASAICIFEIP
jgi:hypothetical protein